MPHGQQSQIVLQGTQSRTALLHEDTGADTPAQGFHSHATRPRVEIPEGRSGDPPAEDVEEGLPDPLGGGPGGGPVGSDQFATPVRTTHDPHLLTSPEMR